MLTKKQETFCIAYIETGNATEAYRRAYDASKMAAATVNRKAKEVIDNGKVTARIAELRAPAAKKAQVTLEGHLMELGQLRDCASRKEQYSAAINAEIARGRVSGLYVDRTELSGRFDGTQRACVVILPDNGRRNN